MPDFATPANFPETDFRAYGIAATNGFLPMMSEENLFDPQEIRRQFEWSWQAVRYRYRSCAECNDEFKARLNDTATDWWKAGGSDEELVYKLERCIYMFFTGALSVFDSFAFCLYFYGNALKPGAFITAPGLLLLLISSTLIGVTLSAYLSERLIPGPFTELFICLVEAKVLVQTIGALLAILWYRSELTKMRSVSQKNNANG